MDITAIGVGASIVSVLMPISLRLVDFIIHLGRRWMQVRHIRKLVKADLTSILNDDPANLTVRSTNPGKVGEVKSVGTDYLADVRLAYFNHMMRNLELAMCDFSSNLSQWASRGTCGSVSHPGTQTLSTNPGFETAGTARCLPWTFMRRSSSLQWKKLNGSN